MIPLERPSTEELKRRVEAARAAGYSDDEIRQKFVSAGWLQAAEPTPAPSVSAGPNTMPLDQAAALGGLPAITPAPENDAGHLDMLKGAFQYGMVAPAQQLLSALSPTQIGHEEMGDMAQATQAQGLERRESAYETAVGNPFRTATMVATDAFGQAGDAVIPGGIGKKLASKALLQTDDVARVMARTFAEEGVQQGARGGISTAFRAVGDEVGKSWRKWVASAGEMPKDVFERNELAVGQIKIELNRAGLTAAQLDRAIKVRSKLTGESMEVLERQVDDALKARGGVDELPEALRPHAQKMRGHIDNLSEQVLAEGDMVGGDMAKVIKGNLGEYVKREYRAFHDPNYVKFIQRPENAEKWDAAFDFLRKESDRSREPATDAQIRGYMLDLVDRDKNSIRAIGSGRLGKMDKTEFMRRKDIARPLRELMGEYHDPNTNYLHSITSMATDVAHHQSLKDIRGMLLDSGQAVEGLKTDVFSYPIPSSLTRPELSGRPALTRSGELAGKTVTTLSRGSQVRPISEQFARKGKNLWTVENMDEAAKKVTIRRGDDVKTYPIGHLRDDAGAMVYTPGGARSLKRPVETSPAIPPIYTTPEIGEALVGAHAVAEHSGWQTINLYTHMAKTGLSPQTHSRNFLSNTFFMGMQGHNPFSPKYGKFAKAGAIDYGLRRIDIPDQGVIDAYEALTKRNLLGVGTRQGDLEYFRSRAKGMGWLERAGDKLPGTTARDLGRSAGQKGKAGTDKILGAYQAEDDFWKIYLYKKEFDRYRKALPEASTAQIEEMAAGVVRDTMPIYPRIGRAAKELRKNVLVSPFISFPSEVVRNTKNTLRLIRREITDPNPAIRAIGSKRLAGMTGSLVVAPSAMVMAGKKLVGMDSEEMNALREFLPEYRENSQMMMVQRDGHKYTAIDLSFMDPFNYVKKPVIAMFRHLTADEPRFEQALEQSFKELLDPAIQPEITTSEALKTGKSLGRISEGSAKDKAEVLAQGAYRTLAPGGLLAGERIVRSAEIPWVKEHLPKKFPRSTKDLKMWQEVLSLAGPRVSTFDVAESFMWDGKDFNTAVRQARGVRSSETGEHFRSPAKEVTAQRKANKMVAEAGQVMLRKIDAARKLGISDREIRKILGRGRANVSNAHIDALLKGRLPTLPSVKEPVRLF